MYTATDTGPPQDAADQQNTGSDLLLRPPTGSCAGSSEVSW